MLIPAFSGFSVMLVRLFETQTLTAPRFDAPLLLTVSAQSVGASLSETELDLGVRHRRGEPASRGLGETGEHQAKRENHRHDASFQS